VRVTKEEKSLPLLKTVTIPQIDIDEGGQDDALPLVASEGGEDEVTLEWQNKF
jgi:hypothetical protein